MAITRKFVSPLNLSNYDVLIEDTSYKSDYFKITQFDGYFYGGRNSFLIAGNAFLKQNTEILIEILNSEGTTVYNAPVANYIEGSSRLIKIEVYSDTPIGVGKIIIMACADRYLDGTPVPDEWKNKYNVRWTSDVVISPAIENKTPIRFADTPVLFSEEKFYFTPSSSAFSPELSVPIDVELTPKYYNTYINGYVAKIKGPGNSSKYSSKYLNGVLSGSFAFSSSINGSETASIRIPITKIFNSSLAESEGELISTDKNVILSEVNVSSSNNQYIATVQPYGILTGSSTMSIFYNELQTENTGSAISFAKLRLINLKTLSGDINKIRISYKASTDPGQYQLLGDIPTTVTELLATDSGSKIVETGYFGDLVTSNYWYAETMSVQPTDIVSTPPLYYNTSSAIIQNNISSNGNAFLLDSINATPVIIDNKFKNNCSYFIGTRNTNTFQLFPTSEYTLSFKAIVRKESASIVLNQPNYRMDAYLVQESGSVGTVLDTNNLGQLIGTIEANSSFLSQNFDTVEFNFTPKINNTGQFGLRFIVYGGFWNIADVSLKTAQELFFSPDEVDILLPNNIYTDNLLTFKAEYLDVNNNSIGIRTLSSPTYFTGSEQSVVITNAISASYALTASYAMNGGTGGGGDTYTNATPVPVTLGGIIAGTTFSSVPLTTMFDTLLYPYQVPTFSAFAISGQSTTLEVGNQITASASQLFTWVTTNSSSVSSSGITITDFTNGLPIASGLANTGTTNQPISAVSKSSATSHVYRISAKNTQDTTFTRDFTVNWRWRMYWGTSSLSSLTASDITGSLISSSLVSNSTGTFNFGAGGYKYIAYPTVFGLKTSFKDPSTGFDVDMQTAVQTAVSNSFGVGTLYYVHRSTNTLGGSISITVA